MVHSVDGGGGNPIINFARGVRDFVMGPILFVRDGGETNHYDTGKQTTDRTNNLSTRDAYEVFAGEDANGHVLNEGNVADRLKTYMLTKLGKDGMDNTPENRERAVRIINGLVPSFRGDAARFVNNAANDWLFQNFPLGQ